MSVGAVLYEIVGWQASIPRNEPYRAAQEDRPF